VRDVESDARAGIRTIPTLLKKPHLVLFLVTVTAAAHGLIIYAYTCGLLPQIGIVLISSLHSVFYILRYCSRCEFLRNTLVDGEWIIYQGIVIFRDFLM
jgi:4-hydroxybenzoate polyprenyltransferase